MELPFITKTTEQFESEMFMAADYRGRVPVKQALKDSRQPKSAGKLLSCLYHRPSASNSASLS